MAKWGIGCFVLLVILANVAGIMTYWGIEAQNRFASLEELVQDAWSQVHASGRRHIGLITILVESARGYTEQQNDILALLSESLDRAESLQPSAEWPNDPQKLAQFQRIYKDLSAVLQRLLAAAENDPNLNENEDFLLIRRRIGETEGQMVADRQRYNDAARAYNVAVRRFPESAIARYLAFQVKSYLEPQTVRERQFQAPTVQ